MRSVVDSMCLILRGREFQTEGAAQKKERCPDVLVLTCGMHKALEPQEE